MKTLLAFFLLASAAMAEPMHDQPPDVSGDPDAIEVKAGETMVWDYSLKVSTVLVQDGGKLTLKPGAKMIFIDKAPIDAEQMTGGLVVFGALEAAGDRANPDILICSENPNGYRGHTIFLHRADIDIEGVEFRDMGRTTVAPLDPVKNHIGRYSGHLHHLYGPRNPTKPYQFRIEYCLFDGFKKWAMAVHDSHYGLVRYNTFRNGDGAAIVTEEGNETANAIADNDIDGLAGSGRLVGGGNLDVTDFAHEGAGIWLAGGLSNVTGNKVRNAQFGLVLYPWQNRTPKVRVPKFPGANTLIDAEVTILKNVEDTRQFATIWGNDLEGEIAGADVWHCGGEALALGGGRMVSPQIGLRTRFDQGFAVAGADIQGEEAIVQHGNVGKPAGTYTGPIALDSCKLTGKIGLRSRSQKITCRNVNFNCDRGALLSIPPQPRNIEHVFDGCTWAGTKIEFAPFETASFIPDSRICLLQPVRIHLLNEAGANYRVWLPEQAPDYLPFPTLVRPPLYLATNAVAGITNFQTHSVDGISTWGDTAPTAETLDGVTGFVELLASADIPANPQDSFQRTGGYANGKNLITVSFPAGIEVQPVGMWLWGEMRWVKVSRPFASKHDLSFTGPQQGVLVWVRDRNGVLMMK